MKKTVLFFFAGLVLAHISGGCTAKQDPAKTSATEGKVVARVNGTTITEEDLSFRLAGPHGQKAASGDRLKALDDAITEELLYQQGLKVGLDQDPKYQAQVARFERQLNHVKRAEMRRRVYNTQIAAKVEIAQADARNYYDKNAEQITTELHLGVMLFNSKEAAGESLEKIRGGATFESVARSVMGSQGSGGREPWDLGFLSWEQIPIDFAEAVYRLKPGEVSDIVSSPRTGYQVFKLFEARKNPKAEFAGLSGHIMNRLRDEKVRAAFEQYVENLKREAKVEKF